MRLVEFVNSDRRLERLDPRCPDGAFLEADFRDWEPARRRVFVELFEVRIETEHGVLLAPAYLTDEGRVVHEDVLYSSAVAGGTIPLR